MAKNTNEKLNIQEAIKAFSKDDISTAGINLFSVLGYDTSLQAPLDNKTYSEFKENYIDSSPAADRFSEEKALTEQWESIDILFQLTDDSFSGTKSLFEESVNPTDIQSYLCFAIELKGNEYSKTQIAGITREVNKLFSIPIIIIFKYGECITLSIINRRVNKRDSERDVLEKVTLIKDIFFEKPHRAHIEILFDMSLAQLNSAYTITNFESLHKAWSEVLDTQTLNKRFYAELSNWYFWAIKTVVYPGYEYEAERNSLFTKEEKLREHNAKNLIRLLTRLLFVWFIKEKELIPEELFDEQVINNLITSFEPDKYYSSEEIYKENKSIYYKAILQNLFFASLNAEQGKRAFRIDGQNQNATSLMRYQRFHNNPDNFVELIESKVPFMNGGLFECLDSQDDEKKGKKGGAIINYEDGFSDRKDNELFVPDYIFFGKDVKVDLSSEYDDRRKKDVTVNGIINILQKYKFTIAENTPVEEDIALDPELLGRVFENLLASYNPETKTNARKQTGSFYTPRPIVEYMVDESLKAYLKTKIKDASLSKGSLEEITKSVEEIENNLDSKLDNLIAYNESEPEFSDEERFKILKYIDECKILDPACGSGAFPMGILQKMVYVIHKLDPQNDNWKQIQIQKISNDANLTPKEKNELQSELLTVFDDNELDYARKLYLIENCIHGIDIQPIATQISRLRFFISLIVDQKVDGNKANFGVRPLPNLENRFVTANSLIGLNDEQAYLSSKEIDELMLSLQKVRHDLFKAKTPKHKFELRQEDKRIRDELEQELLKLGFGKENAKLISTWDPYDKNRSAEFFDAEWMFGIKDGFDIVIGNPPYGVSIQGDYRNEIMKNLGKVPDFEIYYYFIEMANKNICNKGVLSYIIPNTWLFNTFAKNYRLGILKNWNINEILDCSKFKLFESATVFNTIILFQKIGNVNNVVVYRPTSNADSFESLISESRIVVTKDAFIDMNQNWALVFKLSPNIILLSKKIRNNSVELQHYFPDISQGLIAYDKYKGQSEEIIKSRAYHSFEYKEGYKRNLWGEDVARYLIKWNGKEYINYCDGIANPRKPKYFKKKRVLIREITNPSIYACYTEDEYYNDPSVLIILDSDMYSIKVLLGILNSNLASFYHFNNAPKATKGGFPKILIEDVKHFPIPQATLEQQQPIIDFVDKILAAKKADNTADTSAMEAEIDRLVYSLYGLTEEEIKIVEGK